MKKLILSLSICALSGSFAFGQLFSSGNNTIVGNHVGINTANPNRPLTIRATSGSTELLSFQRNNDISNNNLTLWHLNLNHNGLNFVETGEADFRLFLRPGGNVGIGTENPGTRLDVDGSLTLRGSDLRLGTDDGRYAGVNTVQRALVHSNGGDQLLLNFANDFEGGSSFFGKVGINTSNFPATGDPISGGSGANYMLYVDGGIKAEEVKVEVSGGTWGDFVFEENYPLLSLSEVEQHIEETGHLHNVQSAAEIEENGLELKDITVNQQIKIEELYLHLIEMDKRMKVLEEENKALKAALNK